MFDVRYEGLRLIPSRSAARELAKYGFMIADCKEILEKGYSPRKREKNTTEKWMDYGNKTYNVVIVKSFNYMYNEDVYLIIHFGKFTKKKLRVRK
jgi:hypothetical protein